MVKGRQGERVRSLFRSSMEALPVPYFLRSRGHVIGGSYGGSYFLRHVQGVQVVDKSLSRNPTSKACTGAPSKEKTKVVAQNNITRKCCSKLRINPYPFLAMRHYNKNQKEGEHYKVCGLLGYEIKYFRLVGYVRLVLFKAQPKSLDNLPNASNDASTKQFFAIVHQKRYGDTHVSHCWTVPGPIKSVDPVLSKVFPVACKVCHLEDGAAFKLESTKLREKAKAENLSDEDIPKDYYTDYCSEAVWLGMQHTKLGASNSSI